MAFNLIACNGIYPSINNIDSPDFSSYVGEVVTIGNPNQSYTVEVTEEDGDVDLGDITITSVANCVPCVPYDTKFTLESDCCDCDKIAITDATTYSNSIIGHDVSGYRKIIITDPNGVQYVFSSVDGDNPDISILPFATGGTTIFNYPFANNAVDGIYTIELYTFPLYSSTVFYNADLNTIVYVDGVGLFLNVASGIGEDPTDDEDGVYWTPYAVSESTLSTRYGERKKKLILCHSIKNCGDKLVKQAFCEVESSPCGNMCENKKFMQAMKYNATMKAIHHLECKGDWVGVKKAFEILKSICSCGGC